LISNAQKESYQRSTKEIASIGKKGKFGWRGGEKGKSSLEKTSGGPAWFCNLVGTTASEILGTEDLADGPKKKKKVRSWENPAKKYLINGRLTRKPVPGRRKKRESVPVS